MNYEKIYQSIIEKRKANPAQGVIERHHIIPRCLGGSDAEENMIDLTPKEHFLCHYLLAKMHGGSLWSAYYFMSHPETNSGRGIRVTSSQYHAGRINYISYLKTKTGKKNPNYGNSYSKESRDKISKKRSNYIKENHPKAITEKHYWVNDRSGDTFFGSHFDLSAQTGLSSERLRRVSSGGAYSHFGWVCKSSGRENMRTGINTNTADKNKYKWVLQDGSIFIGTRFDARQKLGLTQDGCSRLVLGVTKKHKGVSICL